MALNNMTDSPDEKPKKRRYPQKLYQYVGPEKQYVGMFYRRIAEFDNDGNSWPKSESWKYEGMNDDDVFMISIPENHLQPPPHQKMFCEFNMMPANEDPIVGKDGIGGLTWCGSHAMFKEHFKEKGSQ